MAELIFSTIHPVRAIFMIVKSALDEAGDVDSETLAGMAAWAANDQGWSVEQIAEAMAPINQNVIADLIYSGKRFLRGAAPGRQWLRQWLRHVAKRANVYDQMTMVVVVTDRQVGPGEPQRSAPVDGSSALPA